MLNNVRRPEHCRRLMPYSGQPYREKSESEIEYYKVLRHCCQIISELTTSFTFPGTKFTKTVFWQGTKHFFAFLKVAKAAKK